MDKKQINHEKLGNHMKVIMDDLKSLISRLLHKEAENTNKFRYKNISFKY